MSCEYFYNSIFIIVLLVNVLLLTDMDGQLQIVRHVEPKWDGFLQPPTKK
jgi:hypothetical protein